jgi:hypothetical protein
MKNLKNKITISAKLKEDFGIGNTEIACGGLLVSCLTNAISKAVEQELPDLHETDDVDLSDQERERLFGITVGIMKSNIQKSCSDRKFRNKAQGLFDDLQPEQQKAMFEEFLNHELDKNFTAQCQGNFEVKEFSL